MSVEADCARLHVLPVGTARPHLAPAAIKQGCPAGKTQSMAATPGAASSPESEGEYYRKHKWGDADIKRRHGLHGYDPLDRAFQQIRSEKKPRSTFFASPKKTQDYQLRATSLLQDHVETMKSRNLAFRYAFRGAKLGFSIVVARYGEEGREHVQVEATQPHCDLYTTQLPLKELDGVRDKLMPTDELIAINGEYLTETSAKTFPQILKKIQESSRPLTVTFVLGERREEAHSEQEEARGMVREDLRVPDVQPYVKEALLHRATALDGLRQTRTAVEAERPLAECRTYVANTENGAMRSVPPARACAGLEVDPRSVKTERILRGAQTKTSQAAQDARSDADEAARLLRAYELQRNAENSETFAVDQVSSPGAVAGVCFRDDPHGDAVLGDLAQPLAGYKPDAAWCCGGWTLVRAEGLDEYRTALTKRSTAEVRVPPGAAAGSILETQLPDGTVVDAVLPRGAQPGLKLDAPIRYSRDLSLDVAVSRNGSYEVRATERGIHRRERGTIGKPLSIQRRGQTLAKTLTVSTNRADIAAANGQQTRWLPGPGDTLVITSTFPRLTPLQVTLTFERRAVIQQEDEEEEPFAKYLPAKVDAHAFLRQLNSPVATAGLKYRNQKANIPRDEEDAWNIYIMTEHCDAKFEWLCGQWACVATEGLMEYNQALGLEASEGGPMALGIAVSGDRFYELHVRSAGEYFIERGEFGKATTIHAAGGVTFDKLCDVSSSGRTLAVGTPGAQVVSVKRLSPSDPDLLVTTAYPEVTDAVVCRVFTLKHKWSERNGVGAGHANSETGSAYRLDGEGPRPQTGDDDFFGLDYTCGALGMREGCYSGCVG